MKQTNLPLLYRPLKLVCVLSLVLLNGCNNNDFSDLTQYMTEVKKRPKGRIDPIPEKKIPESFVFNPEDLRDPFKPTPPEQGGSKGEGPDNSKQSAGIKPDTTRRKEELEAFPMETLKMIGTINAKASLWGLIRSSDGTVYRVRVGNYMGQNYGKIIRIEPDRIELMEIVPDQPGTWREQQMTVMLAEETGSKK